MTRWLVGVVAVSVLGCANVATDVKSGIKDQYEQQFRETFGRACNAELHQDAVCGCLADQLATRVPPKKLVELSLHPKDPELKQIVVQAVKTCGAELTP